MVISSYFSEIQTLSAKLDHFRTFFHPKVKFWMKIQEIQTIWEYLEGTLILVVFLGAKAPLEMARVIN